MTDITLPEGCTMRDVFDICQKHNLPSLAQGMIEFEPPEKLRECAAQSVMTAGVHTYRSRMGEPDYKKSIADLVRKVYNEDIVADNVLATAGVAGACAAALMHLRRAKPDATVAIMEPYYTYHSLQVERVFLRGPMVIPAKGDTAECDFDELKRRVEADQVQGVIVTNPHNPSGCVMTTDEVKMLLELSDRKGLFVIMDECYLDMVFDGKVHASPLVNGIRPNVVACRGFSKCMGAQSWRAGYAISDPTTLLSMMQMMDPFYICTNWTQHALSTYFNTNVDDFKKHCRELTSLLRGNWEILKPAFEKRFGWKAFEPHGTMYGMFRHSEATDNKACENAIKAGVGICPGAAFWGDVTKPPKCTGWVRIHVGVAREKAQHIADLLNAGTKEN